MASPFDRPHALRVLAFSGGGLRGLAYIGALRALRDTWGVDIGKTLHFAGTSVGALVAFLLAMGLSVEEMEALAVEQPLETLLFGRMSELWTAYKRGGWNSGDRLVELLEQIALERTGREELLMEDVPFVCGHHLTVVVADLEECEPVYITTRNMERFGKCPVARSVAASMRLPGVFVAETGLPIRNLRPAVDTKGDAEGDGAIPFRNDADGGLFDNFPLPFVCEVEGASPQECLGMRVAWRPTPPRRRVDAGRQMELLIRAVNKHGEDKKWSELEKLGLTRRVLTLETSTSMLSAPNAQSKRDAINAGFAGARKDLLRLQVGDAVSCRKGRVRPVSELPDSLWGEADPSDVWIQTLQSLQVVLGTSRVVAIPQHPAALNLRSCFTLWAFLVAQQAIETRLPRTRPRSRSVPVGPSASGSETSD